MIIGHGRSGKSAAETLSKLCTKASITALDPTTTTTIINATNNTDNKLDHCQSMVNEVNPERNEVVGSSFSNGDNATTTTTSVKANHKPQA